MDIKYDSLDLYRAFALGYDAATKHHILSPDELEKLVLERKIEIPLSGEEEVLAKKSILEDIK